MRTDPSKRAMIGLPDEMLLTPPENAPAPTPATAVLRIPLPEGDFTDAPTPVVSAQLAPRFASPDLTKTEAFHAPAPFGLGQPPPVVDANHPDAVATSVFRPPTIPPPAAVEEPSVTQPSNMRLHIPLRLDPLPLPGELETEASTELVMRPVMRPLEPRRPAPSPSGDSPGPQPDSRIGMLLVVAGSLLVAMSAITALIVTRTQLKAARAASSPAQLEGRVTAVEALLSLARAGAAPAEIEALAVGLGKEDDEPKLLLARGLSHLHAGNWSAAIELLSKVNGVEEARLGLERARAASPTDE